MIRRPAGRSSAAIGRHSPRRIDNLAKRLITRTDLDDALDMRRKLSQSPPRLGETPTSEAVSRTGSRSSPDRGPDRAGIEHPRLWTLIAIAMVFSFSGFPGCSKVDRTSEDATEITDPAALRSDRSNPTEGGFRWPSPTDPLLMQIEVATHDSSGTIEIQLLPEFAPASVELITRLAREGHYDGTTFHRVIRGFMIQGGDPNSRDRDPTNDGRGGARIQLPDELSEIPFERGVVALANRGRTGSNTSQFFILQTDHRDLDGRYTAFGKVTRGLELVDLIANSPTDKVGRWGPKDRPIESISIRRIQISGPAPSTATPKPSPQTKGTVVQLSHPEEVAAK